MARKLRAPVPHTAAKRRGTVGVSASGLRGSPNRAAHWRKVRPYKTIAGPGSAIHDGRQREPRPSAPIAGEERKKKGDIMSFPYQPRAFVTGRTP